jgi:ribosome modulation factor
MGESVEPLVWVLVFSHRSYFGEPQNGTGEMSLTVPAKLVSEVRRAAKEEPITMSRAIVALAERGVQAEAEGRSNRSYPSTVFSQRTIWLGGWSM